VTYAVSLGGDTDTIAAMTGAISGAYHGTQGIPLNWINDLDNEGKGRDYIE
jgi:ADP-ribosylglycohydrolase